MYYPDGSYAGINEIVFNFQPWLDWYLKETGQRLVGGSGPFAPAAGGHGDADATSGASDSGDAGGHGGGADATSAQATKKPKKEPNGSFFLIQQKKGL